MRFEGVFIALVSPFDAAGGLDVDSYRRHLTSLADSGIQGFVPCGTTGEAPTLSVTERDLLIQEAISVARTRKLKVIAGCSGNCTEAVRDQVLAAGVAGCDAALVVTPYYNRPTPEGILAHYRFLADQCPIPLVLYHVPARTGISISVKTASELLHHPNICGIKEASGQYGFWLDLASKLDWRERSWLAGDDDSFAVTLGLGGAGIISATANLVPRHFVQIYQNHLAGDLKAAFESQKRITGIIRAAFIETNPAPIKYALSLQHRMADRLRLPLVSVCEQSQTSIRSAMAELELL